MKKTLLVVLMAIGFAAASNTANAQQKLGYFDADAVLSLYPNLTKIDTLLYIYRTDSLGTEREIAVSEFERLDSTIKKDSAKINPKVLEKMKTDRIQYYIKLQSWQQYEQQAMQQKQQELLAPFYNQIMQALQVVISEGKYTYVFKKDVLWMAPPNDNLIIPVAKKLGLKIPQQGQEGGQQQQPPTQGGGQPKPKGKRG
jgi:Skp family chaperone for outer membrane proteins